jgi:hypothetical protein
MALSADTRAYVERLVADAPPLAPEQAALIARDFADQPSAPAASSDAA